MNRGLRLWHLRSLKTDIGRDSSCNEVGPPSFVVLTPTEPGGPLVMRTQEEYMDVVRMHAEGDVVYGLFAL